MRTVLLKCMSKPPPDAFVAYSYALSENFMFGLPGSADKDKIFLIDFGLSTRSVTHRYLQRKPCRCFVHSLAVSFPSLVACGP